MDARRANLTRFPLFYPEKRTFFLEGADIFDFGSGSSTDVLPFFSRRIGLFDEQQVPLQIGGKANGRAAGANFGALAVHTSEVDSLVPPASMGALRVRQNVLDESSVGHHRHHRRPAGPRQRLDRGGGLHLPDLALRAATRTSWSASGASVRTTKASPATGRRSG